MGEQIVEIVETSLCWNYQICDSHADQSHSCDDYIWTTLQQLPDHVDVNG